MVTWLTRNPNLSALRPIEAHRLVGMMMLSPTLTDYASFRASLVADDVDPALAAAGRRCLALVVREHYPQTTIIGSDSHWRGQSRQWELAYSSLMSRIAAILEESAAEEASIAP
jgi:hypothetical protein